MFTGIVQCLGFVASMKTVSAGRRLSVERTGDWHAASHGHYRPAPGDSICVAGVCLTVVESAGPRMAFDVVPETLARTTLGAMTIGQVVNLEPAVTAGQPLGGHFMQGHADGVGQVAAVTGDHDGRRITIAPPAELLPYVIPKGSIAIDGVSLTLAAVRDDSFDVALIPTTLDVTTLGGLTSGGKVNLEADILAKTVVHTLRQQRRGGDAPPITMRTLRDAGFMG